MDLKEAIINSFPSKMENRQAFIMQFIMERAHKGEKPPSKDELERAIDSLIEDGSFEAKGKLLILKAKRTNVIDIEEEEEDEIVPNNVNQLSNDFNEYETLIMTAFQGKYENKMAVIMNAVMMAASKGKHAPPREKLEEAIETLKEKHVLEEKGTMLIKNS